MPGKAGEKQEVKRNPDGTFPKGVSGNPSGLPRGTKHMTTKLLEAITKVSDGGGLPEDVQIVRALVEKAKQGDTQGIKLIFNYTDGLPSQAKDDPGSEENPIHHVHKVLWE